jgi:hypothetical protein
MHAYYFYYNNFDQKKFWKSYGFFIKVQVKIYLF